jgi:hypothetical protein
MPSEIIELSGSPAELLGISPAAEDSEEPEDDDAASTVSIHTPARQLSSEEKEERRQLLRKIARYRALFPSELSDVQTTGLDVMPLEALRDLGNDVEFLVGTRRSAKAVRGMFLGSLQGVEAAGPYLGLELRGLANVALVMIYFRQWTKLL